MSETLTNPAGEKVPLGAIIQPFITPLIAAGAYHAPAGTSWSVNTAGEAEGWKGRVATGECNPEPAELDAEDRSRSLASRLDSKSADEFTKDDELPPRFSDTPFTPSAPGIPSVVVFDPPVLPRFPPPPPPPPVLTILEIDEDSLDGVELALEDVTEQTWLVHTKPSEQSLVLRHPKTQVVPLQYMSKLH